MELTFHDAVRVARGCMDYCGGHHNDGHLEAYQHGIDTVIRALEATEYHGLLDTQCAALWKMGEKPKENQLS